MQGVYNSYFNGFNEIAEFRSNTACKTIIAALKIFSYFTLIIPVVIALSNWIGRIFFYDPAIDYPGLKVAREFNSTDSLCEIAEEMFTTGKSTGASQLLDEARRILYQEDFDHTKIGKYCKIALLRLEFDPMTRPKELEKARELADSQHANFSSRRGSIDLLHLLTKDFCQLARCYFKLGALGETHKMLDCAKEIAEATCCDYEFKWTCIIAAMIDIGQSHEATELFKEKALVSHFKNLVHSESVRWGVDWAEKFYLIDRTLAKSLLDMAGKVLELYQEPGADKYYFWLGEARAQYAEAMKNFCGRVLD